MSHPSQTQSQTNKIAIAHNELTYCLTGILQSIEGHFNNVLLKKEGCFGSAGI